MKARTVHVETVAPPDRYTHRQLQLALVVAYRINRGRFVLTEAPRS
jgi:hypothetical protein